MVGNLADPDVDARFDAIADSPRPAPGFRERWRGGPEEWREYDDRCRPRGSDGYSPPAQTWRTAAAAPLGRNRP